MARVRLIEGEQSTRAEKLTALAKESQAAFKFPRRAQLEGKRAENGPRAATSYWTSTTSTTQEVVTQ
jgi:hypothetical protein